jgi:RNA recognition motif-containing protein
VKNLHANVDEQRLQDLFSQFGGHAPQRRRGNTTALLPCPGQVGGGLLLGFLGTYRRRKRPCRPLPRLPAKPVWSFLGNMQSVKVMRDSNGQSRGFGFVNFEKHEEAQKVGVSMVLLQKGAAKPGLGSQKIRGRPASRG